MSYKDIPACIDSKTRASFLCYWMFLLGPNRAFRLSKTRVTWRSRGSSAGISRSCIWKDKESHNRIRIMNQRHGSSFMVEKHRHEVMLNRDSRQFCEMISMFKQFQMCMNVNRIHKCLRGKAGVLTTEAQVQKAEAYFQTLVVCFNSR
jgi:hypothetical protein